MINRTGENFDDMNDTWFIRWLCQVSLFLCLFHCWEKKKYPLDTEKITKQNGVPNWRVQRFKHCSIPGRFSFSPFHIKLESSLDLVPWHSGFYSRIYIQCHIAGIIYIEMYYSFFLMTSSYFFILCLASGRQHSIFLCTSGFMWEPLRCLWKRIPKLASFK